MNRSGQGDEGSSVISPGSQNSSDSHIERIWTVSEDDLDPDKKTYWAFEGPFGSVKQTRRQWKNNVRLTVIYCIFVSVMFLAAALMSPIDDAICIVVIWIAIVVLCLVYYFIVREIGRN
jgi:hypothetical protein